jgi:hypothetical protein
MHELIWNVVNENMAVRRVQFLKGAAIAENLPCNMLD